MDEICQNCTKDFWTGLPFNFRLYGQPLQKNACAVKITKVRIHGVKPFHHFLCVFSRCIINRPISNYLGLIKVQNSPLYLSNKKVDIFEQVLIKPLSIFTKKKNLFRSLKPVCCKEQQKKFLTSYWFAEYRTSEDSEW